MKNDCSKVVKKTTYQTAQRQGMGCFPRSNWVYYTPHGLKLCELLHKRSYDNSDKRVLESVAEGSVMRKKNEWDTEILANKYDRGRKE